MRTESWTYYVSGYQSTNIFRVTLCMPTTDDNYIADMATVIFPGILLHVNIQRTHIDDQRHRIAYVVTAGLLIIVICRGFDIGGVGSKRSFRGGGGRDSNRCPVFAAGVHVRVCVCACIVRAHHVFAGVGWRAPARRQRLGPEKVTGARAVKTGETPWSQAGERRARQKRYARPPHSRCPPVRSRESLTLTHVHTHAVTRTHAHTHALTRTHLHTHTHT